MANMRQAASSASGAEMGGLYSDFSTLTSSTLTVVGQSAASYFSRSGASAGPERTFSRASSQDLTVSSSVVHKKS